MSTWMLILFSMTSSLEAVVILDMASVQFYFCPGL